MTRDLPRRARARAALAWRRHRRARERQHPIVGYWLPVTREGSQDGALVETMIGMARAELEHDGYLLGPTVDIRLIDRAPGLEDWLAGPLRPPELAIVFEFTNARWHA